MTAVKDSTIYKTLKKAVRREDHAELLMMLEMASDNHCFSPESTRLISAFPWGSSPQGFDYWFELYRSLRSAGHDCY